MDKDFREPPAASSPGPPPTGVLLAVAAVVFASAWASISLAGASDRVAPIWFANAFVLAFLLKREAGTVEVLGVAFAANVLANVVAGDGLPAGFVLSACNTVELSVALWGLRRDRGPELDLSQARVCLRFGLWGALAGTAVAGLPAAAWLALAQGADPFAVWHRWVAADALGLMVLTPLLVSARRRDLPAWATGEGSGRRPGFSCSSAPWPSWSLPRTAILSSSSPRPSSSSSPSSSASQRRRPGSRSRPSSPSA